MYISKQEWLRLSSYIILILTITTLPYLIAWQNQTATWQFNGFLFGVEDGNSYLGKIRLGVEGDWSFHLFYTPHADTSAPLLYLPYIIVGQIIRVIIDENDIEARFHAMILGFHFLRLIANTALLVAIYLFIAYFLKSSNARFLSLILATLGGGVGWLLGLLGLDDWLGSLPPDFYIPEGFSFLILFGLPHIALARAALLFGLWCLLQTLEQPISTAWRWSVLAGLSWLVVGLGVAFYLTIIYCIILAWGAATWLRTKAFPWTLVWRASIAVILTWPLFFYLVALFTFDTTFSSWSAQNLLPSPHPLHYGLAYIFFWPFAWIGGWWVWHNRPTPSHLLLLSWVLIVPLLVYLPINVQRRLAEGVIVPLAVLSVMGFQLTLASIQGNMYSRRWKRLRTVWLLPALLTSVLILIGSTFGVLNPAHPVFRPTAELEAMDWAANNTKENSVIMGVLTTGNVLAARSNVDVYLGHGPETIDSDDKEQLVTDFFSGRLSDAQYATVLEEIDYVFYGPNERAEASNDSRTAQPEWAKNMRLVYSQGDYQIFEVPK